MAERTVGSPWRVFLRVLGLIIAFGLGVLAACLIAFGSSTKQIQLGVLAGLWSALMGTLSVNSLRHQLSARAAAPAVPVAPPEPAKPTRELEVRETHGVESVRAAAARRDYERQLHDMVERELSNISKAMTEQLDVLRTEVTQLRGELVEKVGGQLRLERIETTRVIGSDIEALQHEVRRLAFARDSLLNGDLGSASSMRSVETSLAYDGPADSSSTQSLPRVPAWSVPAQPVQAQPVQAQPVQAQPVDVQPAPPAAPVAAPPAAAPILTKSSQPASEPQQAVAPPRPAKPAVSDDPFASMPRLSRFTDSEPLLPLGGDDRHAASGEDEQPAPPSVKASTGGGRRRRADGETNDVLARLLGAG